MTPTTPNLNLDDLIAEAHAASREPFTFTIGGETFSTVDPRLVDYQESMALNTSNPVEVIRLYLGPEQHERFRAHKMPGAALTQLLRAIDSHYPSEK